MTTAHRLARLRQALEQQGLDGLLVSQAENRRYLSGFTGSAGSLLITAEEALLATDSRYWEQSAQEAPDFRIVQVEGEASRWLPELLGMVPLRKLGFESDTLTYTQYGQLVSAAQEAEGAAGPLGLVPTSGMVEKLRAVKDADEIEAITRAVHLTDDAFAAAIKDARPGMTERELAWEIEKYMREHGGDGVAFDLIVAAGTHGALPHHRPSDTPILEGQPVVMDIGAKVAGYHSDMTRTICLGSPDDTFRKVYDVVLAAQLAAVETIESGMSGPEADGIARRVIEEAGYGEHFGHGLGHGVGLAIHEEPRLSRFSQTVLEDGMVVTVEPGVYLSHWGGVRIEDIVVMEQGHPRVITRSPKLREAWR